MLSAADNELLTRTGAGTPMGQLLRVAGQGGNAGEQVGEGAGAVAGVAEVLGGIPEGRRHGSHLLPPLILMSRLSISRDFMSTQPLH